MGSVTWALADDEDEARRGEETPREETREPILDYEVTVMTQVDTEETPAMTQRAVKTLRASQPPLYFKGLTSSNPYVFRMRRRSAAGWSQWSQLSPSYLTTDEWTKQEIVDCLVAKFGG